MANGDGFLAQLCDARTQFQTKQQLCEDAHLWQVQLIG